MTNPAPATPALELAEALLREKILQARKEQYWYGGLAILVGATAVSFVVLIWIVTITVMGLLSHAKGGLDGLGKGVPSAALVSLFTFGAGVSFKLIGIPMQYHLIASEQKRLAQRVLDRIAIHGAEHTPVTTEMLEAWMEPYYAVKIAVALPWVGSGKSKSKSDAASSSESS